MLPKLITTGQDGEIVEKVKPLEINFDPEELTLDELCLFDGESFTASAFRQFLADHTNWTKAEAGKLTVRELKDVTEQLGEKMREASVPLASSPR